ncbi:pyridoxal phosphate-dependent aminotransferase [Candidatus Acetothermia bacterium]|nr:MAG: pyridoxal phosphate-dependent aminotransferase [Candidatus Acetothermia bacterium]
MPNISARTAELPASPIRKLTPLAQAAEAAGKTIYHLNIGQPDIPTPKAFMDGVRNADISVLSYSPSRGMPRTLEALRGYYAKHGIELSSEEMCVTIGGSEAFTFAMKAATDPGDEILVPEPFYPNYRGYSYLTNIKLVPITTYAEDGFHLPALEEMEARVTPRTRAIMFSNPGNPTGVVYSRDELERIAELALRHDLFVISDEVYREFVYEGKAVSVFDFPELRDNAILADSISKRISACGARIGVIASHNPEVMSAVNRMAQARLSPPTFGQLGLIAFLNDPHYAATIASMISKFRARRDTLYTALQTIPGIVCRKPAGAFYVIAKLPIDDCESFARFLLTDFERDGETVMVAPGTGFYATPGKGKDEVRIAYVLEEDKLVRAVELLREGLAAYQEATAAAVADQ